MRGHFGNPAARVFRSGHAVEARVAPLPHCEQYRGAIVDSGVSQAPRCPSSLGVAARLREHCACPWTCHASRPAKALGSGVHAGSEGLPADAVRSVGLVSTCVWRRLPRRPPCGQRAGCSVSPAPRVASRCKAPRGPALVVPSLPLLISPVCGGATLTGFAASRGM